MRDGARAQAAIEILQDSQEFKRLPAQSLKDWALKHRFAGSKDRSAIGDIVFMSLRVRALSSFMLGGDNPRNWVLGALKFGFGLETETIKNQAFDNEHSFTELSEDELAALDSEIKNDIAPWIIGNYPEWLDAELEKAFGDNRANEMAELSKPAPLDIRVNIDLLSVDETIEDISNSPKLTEIPQKTKLSPWGIRIPWSNGKNFAWSVEPAYLKGFFEVQDEASQLVALLTGAKPEQTIADVCAGAGGKTLALAAMTGNEANIIAYDHDPNRIAPIYERVKRASAKNIDIRGKRRGHELEDLKGLCDIVLVDAPCTGAGTWRRSPDTKWRLTRQNIEKRNEDQQAALKLGEPLVKKGGLLIYATCSILPQENDDSIDRLFRDNPSFRIVPIEDHLANIGQSSILEHTHKTKYGIQFTPLKSDTDGFYFVVLQKK